MAVTNITPTITYVKDGVTEGVVHPIPFKLLQASDLEMYVDGVLSNDAFTVGGTLPDAATVVTGPDYVEGTEITFRRNVEYKQETTFAEGERYPGKRIENEFDNLAMQIQQLNEGLGRSVQTAPGGTAPDGFVEQAADTVLGQDGEGALTNRTQAELLSFLGITDATDLAGNVALTTDGTTELEAGVKANLSTQWPEATQEALGWVTVEGPGIDPTGETDSSLGLNKFFSNDPSFDPTNPTISGDPRLGRFRIPAGRYRLDHPVILYRYQIIEGAGTGGNGGSNEDQDSTRTTLFFPDTNFDNWQSYGVKAMFVTQTWLQGNWMHHFQMRDLCIDGTSYPPQSQGGGATFSVPDMVGIACHQMGELAEFRTVFFRYLDGAGAHLTGSHAPATITNCDANLCGTGFILYRHPLYVEGEIPNLTGSAGPIRFINLMGDGNITALIHIRGGQHVTVVGLKTEGHYTKTPGDDTAIIRFDGGGIGAGITGGSASLTMIGGFSQDTGVDGVQGATAIEQLIRIEEGVTPDICLLGYQWTPNSVASAAGDTCLINDVTRAEKFDLGLSRSGQVIYSRSSRSRWFTDFSLGNGKNIWMTDTNGVQHIAMDYASTMLRLTAGSSQGVALRDSTGAIRFRVNGLGVGFNTEAPITKPIVTGDTDNNAALESLLTHLHSYGLIDDQSTSV